MCVLNVFIASAQQHHSLWVNIPSIFGSEEHRMCSAKCPRKLTPCRDDAVSRVRVPNAYRTARTHSYVLCALRNVRASCSHLVQILESFAHIIITRRAVPCCASSLAAPREVRTAGTHARMHVIRATTGPDTERSSEARSRTHSKRKRVSSPSSLVIITSSSARARSLVCWCWLAHTTLLYTQTPHTHPRARCAANMMCTRRRAIMLGVFVLLSARDTRISSRRSRHTGKCRAWHADNRLQHAQR